MEKYIIVSSGCVRTLAVDVNAKFKDGYRPLAGVSFGNGQFHQAMVNHYLL